MEDIQTEPLWSRLFSGHNQPAPEQPSLQIFHFSINFEFFFRNGVRQHQPTSHCVAVIKNQKFSKTRSLYCIPIHKNKGLIWVSLQHTALAVSKYICSLTRQKQETKLVSLSQARSCKNQNQIFNLLQMQNVDVVFAGLLPGWQCQSAMLLLEVFVDGIQKSRMYYY